MRTLVLLGIVLSASGAFAVDPVKSAAPLTEREQIAALTAERDKAMQMLAAMEKRVAELEKRLTTTEAAHKQLSQTHSSLLQRLGPAAAATPPAVTSPGSVEMRKVGDSTYQTRDGTTYTILPGGQVIRTER
jgi:hypothetical protein